MPGMKWERWLDTWDIWSRTEVHRRRFERAVGIAQRGAEKGTMYASISGGKDSIGLLAVLSAAGVRCRAVHATGELNLPESMAVTQQACAHFDYTLDTVESEHNAWRLLKTIPGEWADAGKDYQELLKKFAAGDLLIQYAYHEGVDGWFDGRRADENKRTRGELFRTRGPLFQSVVDGLWTCCPLAWWTGRDSFAAAVASSAPIHPFYERSVRLCGEDPEQLRVDWLFGPSITNSLGRMVAIQRVYPGLWDRLVAVRPEMASYGE